MPKKWKIHNVFYVFLLEQNTTKKKQVNDTQLDFEFEISNNEEYKVDGIWNSTVYTKESIINQLPKGLLSSFVEKLPWEKRYLGVCIGNPTLLKVYYCQPQRQSREADTNFSSHWYGSTNS